MSGYGVLALIAVIALVALPLATYYKPFAAGILGILALTSGAVFFAVAGKSAMTETTAAIFGVGAFLLAGVLALVRVVTEVKDAIETRTEN